MINFTIQATGIELTSAIRGQVEKKLVEIEKKLDPNDGSVQAAVEVGIVTKHHRSGKVFFAEINLHAMKKRFRATEKAENLYAALDVVKDEIIREVTSKEKKDRTTLRKGARAIKSRLKRLS